jgi:3'(2'), 5'-bisphosphate nucleotidase
LNPLLNIVANITEKAGTTIAALPLPVPTRKANGSWCSAADQLAHQYIRQALAQCPVAGQYYPILSEEMAILPDLATREQWSHYWCVDPLDGTQDYLAQTKDYAVCIALIRQEQPWLGAIYLPAIRKSYVAQQGVGAYQRSLNGPWHPLHTAQAAQPLRVLISRFHRPHALIAQLPKTVRCIEQGSARKFCSLAEGEADLILAGPGRYEWDTAAGHCILAEAGGKILALNGNAFPTYNQNATFKVPAFLACGDLNLACEHWFSDFQA